MAGIAFSLFMIIALGMIGISLSMKLLQNYKPGRNKIQEDLKKIRAELAPMVVDLVPWSEEEMEQLSLNQMNRLTKKGVVTTSKGVFTTIYHEPVIAWVYKKYVGPKENGLLYARTSEKEYIYRIKNGEVEMVAGDRMLGVLDSHGILLNAKGNKPMAQVSRKSEGQMNPIKVNDKLVGGLANASNKQKVNTRAFPHLTKMEKEEEEIFLSLSILELVKQEMRN